MLSILWELLEWFVVLFDDRKKPSRKLDSTGRER